MAIEEAGELPALGGLYRRAILGGLTSRSVDGAPQAELLVRGVRIDRDHIARYNRACGFRVADTVPVTYPHVVAFPLALELMTRPEFPFGLIGLVHIGLHIEQSRALTTDDRLDITVRAENLRDHERGRAIDVLTTVATLDPAGPGPGEAAESRIVWRERSTYLRRSRRARPTTPRPDDELATEDLAGEASAVWPVSTAAGPSYAAVSGDHNPIHTSWVAARLFGFPRPIAHGMWSIARCVAALEGRVPDQCVVEATLKAPVLLPGTVAFSSTARVSAGTIDFALRDARTGRLHLSGTVAP